MTIQVDSDQQVVLRDPPRAGTAAATLVDIFRQTAASHPDALALDDGTARLTYAELADLVRIQADRLAAAGVRRGDRVGIRIPSGTAELYVAVLAVLHTGAAYVPADAEDPPERATACFADAGVRLVVGPGLALAGPAGAAAALAAAARRPEPPTAKDEAWVIFTSGTTGRPKGVAVTHRSAVALVQAESDLFLPGDRLGPGDRVMAGLSVAFDASCEEMWLAWRHGAALLPAPRALVRAGADLARWIGDRGITVVSTVPTLAALWPAEAVAGLRLLIFGGEAVPADLVDRLWRPGLAMWNTYGPTEATVVACAAPLAPGMPVRIGHALPGWDLAVVGPAGEPVPDGEVGELVIGGIGLARYLDPDLDAQRFAPAPTLGWARAYRTGDRVRADSDGLVFVGRTDDQVKVNGRRIELGEVDAALRALPGVSAAAGAIRRTASSTQLVGYVVAGAGFDAGAAVATLRDRLPAALVPLVVPVPRLPLSASGKVDREALPWPVAAAPPPDAGGTAAEVAAAWSAVLGVGPDTPEDDFFGRGGSSLGAALLAAELRDRYPRLTVAEVYEHPTPAGLAAHLDRTHPDAAHAGTDRAPAGSRPPGRPGVRPVPMASRIAQLLLLLPLRGAVALRWLTCLAALNAALQVAGVPWAAPVPWWWMAVGWLLTVSPPGRLGLAALVARLLLRGVGPGRYPRGGAVHLRLWAAQRFADGFGAITPATAPWVHLYARALGARVGRDVDLHSIPPVTGLLTLGKGCAIEREVDLSGCWLEGDVLHVGAISIGARARVGARSVLYPGARVGPGAEVAAGAAVLGEVPAAERWAGAPAVAVPDDDPGWPEGRPRSRRGWIWAHAAAGAGVAMLPLVAAVPALALVGRAIAATTSLGEAVGPALAWGAAGAVVGFALYALLIAVAVRALGQRLAPGTHPVRSGAGVRAWAVERLADAACAGLFPLYASVLTPLWLRALGARVGRGAEISTVAGLPSMMRVKGGSFLADDTLVAPYELRSGWLRIAPATVGTQAFLGNSGMTAAGRKVPKRGLVAVLSAAPRKSRKGSSYLGSPPAPIPRARIDADGSRTYRPPGGRVLARAALEVLRLVPVVVAALIGLGVLLGLQAVVLAGGWAAAIAAGGPMLLAAGAAAGLVTVAAKWLLVGRYRAADQALWSAAVWRGELADTFTEYAAARFLAEPAAGSPALVWFLRALGARIGRGTWCETYWLPEPDLVRVGAGASIGAGCVVQTHLFHDRVMSLGTVTIEAGATLATNSVALPGATLGAGCAVGPGSLVLRGERLPADSRWTGNPVAPWPAGQVPTRT